MWVQLEVEQTKQLLALARGAQLADIAERIQHYLNLEASRAPALIRYRRIAEELYGTEGELEFDDDAVVSAGTGDGAYVMGWRWVDSDDQKRTAVARRHRAILNE